MLMISPSHDKSIPLDKEGGMGRHLRSHKEMMRRLEWVAWSLLTVSRIYLLLNLFDPIHSIYSFP